MYHRISSIRYVRPTSTTFAHGIQGTNDFHLLSDKVDRYLQAHHQGYHPFAEIESQVEITTSIGARGASCDGGEGNEDVGMEDMDDMEELYSFPSPPPPGFGDPWNLDEMICEDVLVLLRGSSRKPDRITRLGVSCNSSEHIGQD